MTTSDPQVRRRWLWAAAVLSPLLVVQAVRLIDESSLSAAPAASYNQDPDAPSNGSGRPAITTAQARALEFIASLPKDAAQRSPLDRPDPVPDEPKVVERPVEVPKGFPSDIRVTAIIGDEGSGAALVSHKLRRAGDEIADGWWIERIDVKSRRVNFVNARGERIWLEPPTPRD